MALIIIDMVDGMKTIKSSVSKKKKPSKKREEIYQRPELPLQEVEPSRPEWKPPPIIP